MSGTIPAGMRSSRALWTRSLLGAAWFALWFFALFPALILWWLEPGWAWEPGLGAWLGAGCIACASVVLVAEIAAFVRRGGTHVPLDPPPSLIATGLYARVRNPMYASYLAIAVGEALVLRSWALFGYAVVLAAIAHGYVVWVEEPALRRRFGDGYTRYAAATGRWLPRVRRSEAAGWQPEDGS